MQHILLKPAGKCIFWPTVLIVTAFKYTKMRYDVNDSKTKIFKPFDNGKMAFPCKQCNKLSPQ